MAQTETVDFNIHDLVGIRLLNASPSDVEAVARQLGPMQRPITGQADVTIRFEKSLELQNLRLLGLNSSGFTEDGYYVVYNKKVPVKVRIPFEKIGGRCEIVCESGLRAVPLLIAILNLTLLNKGAIPLHASAFVYQSKGILTTGWSKGGKTEAMLSFTHHGGARYVGDEWVILAKGGDQMFGLPEPITAWDWHLEQLPKFRSQIKPSKFRFFKGIRLLDKLVANSLFGRTPIGKTLRSAMPALRRQLHVNIPPEKLFGIQGTDLSACLDKVFFVMSHDSSEITVQAYQAERIARRMVASLEYEQLPLREQYYAFKFAFPNVRNVLIEKSSQIQFELLNQALRGKEAYLVRHPYPVSLADLYDTMRPYCETDARTHREHTTNGVDDEAEKELENAEPY